MNMEQAGRLATAVRFGNRLAPSVGRHLTGQKGFQASPTHKAVGRVFLWPADHALFSSPVCDFVGDVPEDIPEGVPLRAKGFPKRRC